MLLGALYDLATDTAIVCDVNPDFLTTKALLAISLQIESDRHSKQVSFTLEKYQWFIDLLKSKTKEV